MILNILIFIIFYIFIKTPSTFLYRPLLKFKRNPKSYKLPKNVLS